MKLPIRSALVGTFASAMAVITLAVAPAAHAGNMVCSSDTATSWYFADCNRYVKSDGGVSGAAALYHTNSLSLNAYTFFHPRTTSSNYVGLRNDLNVTTQHTVYYYTTTGKKVLLINWYLEPGQTHWWENLNIPRKAKIRVAVYNSSSGGASNTQLKNN
ncbi:hypothetical protein NPS70_16875 [Streptomyces sp. C10-9-1]|uniref:hypothetical protein n=1 Tax=Streptomyces sp. C10-9-1 TaxID=1859285 RepID=UPI0021127656|nr:hypothetical protein [Streptomyces sp. C10-9-1]MCQ6554853.1 hypothetical protein [Streptomyces sp. C10-9-1]